MIYVKLNSNMMKKLFTLLAIFIGLGLFAQNNEVAPGINCDASAVSRDTFNLEFSFPCTAFTGEYGTESNGSYIYVTQWLNDSIAKYDLGGNVIETFTIPGVGHIRDLTYDGQYYYGSPNADYFYVLDLDNHTLVNTITTPFTIRGMAYDSDNDVLWASEHWSPMFYKMDKQGEILDSWLPSGITLESISGLAYDNHSFGGPFLWGFSQDSSGAMIVKYNITLQTQTGNMIDVSGLGTNNYTVAGGLFIDELSRTSFTIGGMIQNDLIFGLSLEYANQLVDIGTNDFITSLNVYPNPVNDQLNVDIDIDGESTVTCTILNQTGQIMAKQNINIVGTQNLRFNTQNMAPGMYFVRISNGGNYSFIKKFIKAE